MAVIGHRRQVISPNHEVKEHNEDFQNSGSTEKQ